MIIGTAPLVGGATAVVGGETTMTETEEGGTGGGYRSGAPRRRSSDYDRQREDVPVERPKLQLQPRSKPREDQPSSGTTSMYSRHTAPIYYSHTIVDVVCTHLLALYVASSIG